MQGHEVLQGRPMIEAQIIDGEDAGHELDDSYDMRVNQEAPMTEDDVEGFGGDDASNDSMDELEGEGEGVSWQNEINDATMRGQMKDCILPIITKHAPGSPPNRLPDFVRRLEDGLYKEATSREDYLDLKTLEARLQEMASRIINEPVVRPHRYCLNCTGRVLLDQDLCRNCGHLASADAELLLLSSPPPPESDHPGGDGRVALLFDERMELHDEIKTKGCPHPERPDRIRAVVARLLATGLKDRCRRVACREASYDELFAVHAKSLVHRISQISSMRGEQKRQETEQQLEAGSSDAACPPTLIPTGHDPLAACLPPDTYVNEHSFMCASLAAGTSAQVAIKVAQGEFPHGAAIVRPPGHHAESNTSMGFCFFNNAAVAARAAQSAGAQRILILDWDIHHGNGTQHIFDDDPSVLYVSLHRHDRGFYPGSGAADEVGVDQGEGFSVNVAWDGPGIGNGDYLCAFNQLIIPIAYEFNPDLIIVSAGFDAADGDPIGECRVTSECFGHMTAMLKAIAPLVLLLEGGYNLKATASATEACLRVLLGEQPGSLPGPRAPSAEGRRAVLEACAVQSAHWKSVIYCGPDPRVEMDGGPECFHEQDVEDEDDFQDGFDHEEEEEEEEEEALPSAPGILSNSDETEAWHNSHPNPERQGPQRQASVNSSHHDGLMPGAAFRPSPLKRGGMRMKDKWKMVLKIQRRAMRLAWRKRLGQDQ